MSDTNMQTELSADLEEAILKKVEQSVPTMLWKVVERKKHSPEESGNRENSPSSVATKSDSSVEETPGPVNRQPDPSIASDLASKLFGERKTAKQDRRSRAAQDRTNAGINKARAKKGVRCKSKNLFYYVILEHNEPLKICKGWPAARRESVGRRGRWSQRFDTRDEAEDFMNNPDGTSDESDEEE